jgi:hypothetical protein
MKGMEGREGKKTVFSEPMDDDAEGYVADISMVAVSEEAATPVEAVKAPAVPTTNCAQVTPAKHQKQPKRIASLAKASSTPASSPRSHSSTRPRFTAPSALDSLPSNMFVTSVYFPWPHGKKASKPKEPLPNEEEPEESYAADQSVVEQNANNDTAVEPDTTLSNVVETVTMPTSTAARGSASQTEREKRRRAFLLGKEYVPPAERQEDDPDHVEEAAVDAQMNGHPLAQSNGHQADGRSAIKQGDWDRADAEWESLNVVTADSLEKLVEGSILAWKVSLLPYLIMEFMTHSARF